MYIDGNPNITSTIDFGPSGCSRNAVDPAGNATYATPFFNAGTDPGCGGGFLGLNGGQSTTITFSSPINYFGLYWGSPDGYNSLDLYHGANLDWELYGVSIVGPNGGGNYMNFYRHFRRDHIHRAFFDWLLFRDGQPFLPSVGRCFRTGADQPGGIGNRITRRELLRISRLRKAPAHDLVPR